MLPNDQQLILGQGVLSPATP